MKRPRAFMSREVWDAILRDYVVPFRHVNASESCPPALLPHKDGEPLLHKGLETYLRAAADLVPDVNIDIYSHGLLLPRRPGFIDFLASLTNKVRLLVSFHFHNHDGSENDYAPLTAFLREHLTHWPARVELILASHLIAPMTRERLDEWAASWRGYNIAVHANANINPWAGLMADVATCAFHGCAYEHFDHMFFGATGNVIACCLDLEEEIVFGNVLRDDPRRMFETVRDFYAAQRRREWTHPVCANCFGEKREDVGNLLQVGVKG